MDTINSAVAALVDTRIQFSGGSCRYENSNSAVADVDMKIHTLQYRVLLIQFIQSSGGYRGYENSNIAEVALVDTRICSVVEVLWIHYSYSAVGYPVDWKIS
jgi:hypothetical protein